MIEEDNYIHVKKRLKQRFDLDIEKSDYEELSRVATRCKTKIHTQNRHVCIVDEWKGIACLPVVWDKDEQMAVTVLTHAMALYKIEGYGHVAKALSGNYYSGIDSLNKFIEYVNKNKVVV